MKVIQETGAAPIMSGKMETVNIGISDNAEDQLMILNVLSNTLYTDKVAAVLREYGCNAYDANVEAGCGDKPIEVRLPNRLDPTVAIRDFGLGMTEAQILNTFCKLGRSTKRSSNAFTGMLGIGSKAGFAYGDSFTVTSYAEGTKTIYGCNRLQGVPKLSKMHQEPTDAPDGVEVKVPVRQADIAEFVTKAERVFRYFKIRPIFHGAKIEFDLHTPKFKGANWRYIGSGESVAVMGNVGYDLKPDSLGTGSDVNYGSKVWTLIKSGVEVDFNIGDLEIAANREGLQYRDHTKKQITLVCKQIVAEIGKVFTDSIAKATSLWEAMGLYGELFERRSNASIYTNYNISGLVAGHVVWKGHKIGDGRFDVENKEKDPNVRITRFWANSGSRSRVRRDDRVDRVHTRNTLLVINDLPSRANSPTRMAGAFEQDTDLRNIIVFAFLTTAAQKKYWAARELDGAPTKNLSDIPPAAVTAAGGTGAPSAHRAKHQASAFILNEVPPATSTYSAVRSLEWTKATVDAKDGAGVYVVLDSFYVQPPDAKAKLAYGYEGSMLRQHILEMRKAGLLAGQKIYGFKRDRVVKLGSKWVPLREHLNAYIATLVTQKAFAQDLADYIAATEMRTYWNEACRAEYPSGSLFREYLDDLHKMRNPKSSKVLMAYVQENRGAPWLDRPTLPKRSIDLYTKEATVLKKYPALGLQLFGNAANASQKERATIAEYVKLIESI